MKVKELIEHLLTFGPDEEVYAEDDTHPDCHAPVTSVGQRSEHIHGETDGLFIET